MATAKPKGGFLQCLTDKLTRRPNWGKEKLAAAKREFNRRVDDYVEAGTKKADAERLAAGDVLASVEAARKAKVKAGLRAMEIKEEFADRLDESLGIRTLWGKGNQADKLYHALRSVLEDEGGRLKGFTSWEAEYHGMHGKMMALVRDLMDNFGKGAFGRQLGKARIPNVGRELFNAASTGDKAAADIATAYRKSRKLYVSSMNNDTAVTLRAIDDEGLPVAYSSVNLANTPPETFVADMMGRMDWNKTRWPNGERVAVGEREKFLADAHFAMRTGDWKAFDDKKAFEMTGGRWGMQLQQERMFQFKSYEAWQEMHDKYGDGNLYDVITRSFDKMAYNYALVKTLGSSPDYMIKEMVRAAKNKANNATGKGAELAAHKIDAHVRRIETMADGVLRHNPMDTESFGAMAVATTSNLAASAMLKSAVIVSVPGDISTTVATRLANHQSLIGFLGEYLRVALPGSYRKASVEMLNLGFIVDDLISNNYMAARFGTAQQYGPAWSQRVTDFTMRASLMSRMTNAARMANQREMLGRIANVRNMPLKDIPERVIFERAGVTDAEWDTIRAQMPLWSPRQGTEFFRPVDVPEKLRPIADKMQRMVWNESRRMVLASSLEATTRMRRGIRPDSAGGALLHSATMFMNFPVTNMMVFSRLVMSLDSKVDRAKVIATLGIGGAIIGAFSQQVRGMLQGKEADPMNTPEFWIKAAASGGALGIWGDYVTGAMRSDTATQMAIKAGGPLASMAGEAWDLTAGAAFQWAQIGDRTAEMHAGSWGADVVDFARNNVIPQTWLYATVLERDILEPLQEMMDPVGTRRSQAARTRRAKEQGTPYRRGFEPGNGILTGR